MRILKQLLRLLMKSAEEDQKKRNQREDQKKERLKLKKCRSKVKNVYKVNKENNAKKLGKIMFSISAISKKE